MTADFDPHAIAASNLSISDKIRRLAAGGLSRRQIADHIGRSYQQVRQVLVEDERRAGRRRPSAPSAPLREPEALAGVAEPGRRFEGAQASADVEDRGGGAYRLAVREDGSVVLPPAVRAALGIDAPGAALARLEGAEFKLIGPATALKRIQDMLRPYAQEGVSWVDELIADRRREAAREDDNA